MPISSRAGALAVFGLQMALLACSGASPDRQKAGSETASDAALDTRVTDGSASSEMDKRQRDAGDAELPDLLDGSVGMRGSVLATPDDEASAIYDQDALHTFELKLSQRDLDLLDRDPVAEQYVPGTLIFQGKTYGPVGVRYKGSVGSFVGCTASGGLMPSGPKTCPKLSMKVSLDWKDPEGQFYGLKKLLFHAMNSDDSLMRDRLAYELFRAMGVPAPRSTHARLLINGKLAGLFALVEEVDGRFTRSRFSDGGEGNLYKEVWPIHESEKVYLDALETNRDASTRAVKMVDFAWRLARESDATLGALIDARMNREITLGYVAVDRTIRNDDGAFHWYCGIPAGQGNNPGRWGNHNYYFYEETTSSQVWVIPWDMDLAFRGERAVTPITSPWNDTQADCACAGTFVRQRAPACDPLIRGWATMKDDFDDRVRAFLDGPFSADRVTRSLDTWAAQIAPVVTEAAGNPGQLSVAAWQTALTALRKEISALRTAAQSHLL